MKKYLLTILLTSVSMLLFADNDTIVIGKKEEPTNPKMTISGYVKADYYYDTRQVVATRADHLLLYPKPESLDANGNDINAISSMQFVPIQTRLSFGFSGVEVLNADVKATIEGEFAGMSDANINGFRLRHANVVAKWQNGISTLMGQAWHPQFIEECFPQTANINTGIPFNPFARSPQIQLRYDIGKFHFQAAAVTQIDFMSTGPNGNSFLYMKNASMPELVGKIMFKTSDGNNNFLFGGTFAYKTLKPRLINSIGTKVNETISTKSASVFAKYNNDKFAWKVSGIVGEDMYHLTMIGGYAVKMSNYGIISNIFENELLYTPLISSSVWSDLVYGNRHQFGLFTGFSRNYGSNKNIFNWENTSSYFARGQDIHHLYRISPRYMCNIKNISFGTELEYTIVAYGKKNNSLAEVFDLYDVFNFRALLFIFYKF